VSVLRDSALRQLARYHALRILDDLSPASTKDFETLVQALLAFHHEAGSRWETDAPSITCPRCRKTSYHINDVRQRYCGNCHVFLREEELG